MTTTTARGVPTGSQTTGEPVRRQARRSPITLTGRGGIVAVFGFALLGALLGSESALGIGLLPGLAFVIGCVLAAVATRPSDLLTVAVAPPLIFFLVVLATSLTDGLAGGGSLIQTVSIGVITALASNAPWLFVGTLLVLVITIPRGLPGNLRELRELRGNPAGGRDLEDDYDDPVRWDESRTR
jgi:hypothetical protein